MSTKVEPTLQWTWQPYLELSRDELYEIAAARQEVFVLGQGIRYVDFDGLDQKAFHLQGRTADGTLLAYLRAFPPGKKYTDAWSIGRVLTCPQARGRGYGRSLMRAAAAAISEHTAEGIIRMSAQAYLQRFYEELGYQCCSEIYLEEGIEHVEMQQEIGRLVRLPSD